MISIHGLSASALLIVASFAIGSPASAQDARNGALVFKRCRICHSTEAGKGATIGPHLSKIVGRKAGAIPKFAYSKPMASAGFVWNKGKLDTFLAKPQAVVRRTTMAYGGLPNAKERADLIAYLATLQ